MTMRKIESGTGTLQSTTLTSLDKALKWPQGASLRALDPQIESLDHAIEALGEVDIRRIKIRPRTELSDVVDRRTPRSRHRSEHPRPQQQRAINTRALLVAAAAHEFASTGYAAASINTILDTAQCTKGAMYFHFKSKEEMAHAVLDEIHTTYTDIAQHWTADDSAHPLDAIACLIDEIADADDDILRAETRLVLEPEFRTRRPSATWEAALTELADTAHKTGALRGRTTAQTLTKTLVNGLAGARYRNEVLAAGQSVRDSYREAADLAFAAFADENYLNAIMGHRQEQTA
ncbi:TetR family transcriptional regulator [Rhodococcoides yunnanense]|uniref:TetR family transcriptional regulator n=1 Tax=Rhodococcoides yunnanense TaxID=278209 RepID=UPI0022B09301|nr:TetR family transcriptional regulator [Rhodococcus yunnanensis]MCZ4277451.1 TetR family transcriptional regulator [Rhodococcus yunnanensis]